ncbi:hypothetical protein QMP26_41700 (plasmid) [Enterocloster clostridioformis]
MTDYEVKTAILINTGFDDRECNSLMYEDWKVKVVEEIREVFAGDVTLAGYITSNLNFAFTGYKVKLEYTFSCNDESEQEAESFSEYCIKGIEHNLGKLGYRVENITCHACEMDMGWLDELEERIFHKGS